MSSPLAQAPGQSSVPLGGDAAPVSRELLAQLVEHTSFGFQQSAHDEARQLGFERYVEWQLAYHAIDDSDLEARLSTLPTLGMTPFELYGTYGADSLLLDVPKQELRRARLLRATFSRRQLYERMVEFWTDHFNIKILDRDNYLKGSDDRQVIRAHALGNFGELLSASARSGAMLVYLDNHLNVEGGPNENYAREVMELHTLGVDGPYTEDDVRELARCFTGWTLKDSGYPEYGQFNFRAQDHDNGDKQVLGITIPSGGGVTDGETILAFLAQHPKTALFLCTKLARFLLRYDPPLQVIADARSTFLTSGGDIRATVRTILTPANLDAARTAERPKLKRPLHMVASLLRALDADLPDPQSGVDAVASMGQLPFDWPAPNGYPDSIEAWGATLLPRWQVLHDICMEASPWSGVTFSKLVQKLGPFPVERWASVIARLLTGNTLPQLEVARVQAFIDAQAGSLPLARLAGEAVGLVAISPSYQRY